MWRYWAALTSLLDSNNNKMEHLYHATARQAFKFCLKYDRRQEFRRLCSMLSMHLQQVGRCLVLTSMHHLPFAIVW